MPNFLQASLKAAAVCGIFMLWANITISLPKKDTLNIVRKVVCQNCGNVYNDDDFDVITERCLCFDCRE